MDSDTPTATPEARRKITALMIIILSGLQQAPGFSDEEWAAAEELKNRLDQELQ